MAETKAARKPGVVRTRGGKPQVRSTVEQRWTQAKQQAFLAHLAATCNVAGSLRAVEMSASSLYRLRIRSAAFRAAWEEALREGYAKLELILLERAIKGTVKPVFHGGEKISSIREYSDRLALTLLNAHRGAAASAGAGAAPKEDVATVRARIEAKLSEMNARMGGDG